MRRPLLREARRQRRASQALWMAAADSSSWGIQAPLLPPQRLLSRWLLDPSAATL